MEEQDMRKALDLSGLTMFDINSLEARKSAEAGKARRAALKAECIEKYGDDWERHYMELLCPPLDYDVDMLAINEAAYYGRRVIMTGTPTAYVQMERKQEKRFREIYGDGYGDGWSEAVFHAPCDPVIGEWLLSDAIRTGKWKELPRELRDEYARRTGGTK